MRESVCPRKERFSRRPAWPEDAVFRRLLLDVESDSCEHCGATLHVCYHRFPPHPHPSAGGRCNASPMSPGRCCQIVASTFSNLTYHTRPYSFRKAGELGFEPGLTDPESDCIESQLQKNQALS